MLVETFVALAFARLRADLDRACAPRQIEIAATYPYPAYPPYITIYPCDHTHDLTPLP